MFKVLQFMPCHSCLAACSLQVHADTLRDDEAGVRVATVLVYLVSWV